MIRFRGAEILLQQRPYLVRVLDIRPNIRLPTEYGQKIQYAAIEMPIAVVAGRRNISIVLVRIENAVQVHIFAV